MNNATNISLCLPPVSVFAMDFAVTVEGYVNTPLSLERCECLIGLFWHRYDAEDVYEHWKAKHPNSGAKLYEKMLADEQPIQGVKLYDWKLI